MRWNLYGWALLGSGVLLLAGCGGDSGEQVVPDTDAEAVPQTKQATLRIEGMAEPMVLELFQTPDGFPLPFRTYVPADMIAEADAEEDGANVHFTANFGGVRTDSAELHLFVQPPGATEDAAREVARGIAEAHGLLGARGEVETADRYPWAITQFELGGEGPDEPVGWVALGAHAGRFFHLTARYPPEFGDGFAPRVQEILEEWRWEDTGAGLGGG